MFSLGVVVVLTAMLVLSALGMNIGPLLAGAGVVGLALGFGTQTLVRDVVSGAFFLIDDAFRLGEYIEAGGIKGTVEKIGLRAMQVRHHHHVVPMLRQELDDIPLPRRAGTIPLRRLTAKINHLLRNGGGDSHRDLLVSLTLRPVPVHCQSILGRVTQFFNASSRTKVTRSVSEDEPRL